MYIKTTSKVKLVSIALFLTLNACKKDNDNVKVEEPMPKLGTCQPVATSNGLIDNGDGSYEYKSQAGVTIKIHRDPSKGGLTITCTSVNFSHPFTYQMWGDGSTNDEFPATHENLNGKHLKDRIGKNRTIIYPEGVKITCEAIDSIRSMTAISIYEGSNAHHFNVKCGVIEYSASNGNVAKYFDEMQPDGETTTYEIIGDELMFYNIYTENEVGKKIENRVNLGSLIRGKTTQVNDLFDDPRLGHT